MRSHKIFSDFEIKTDHTVPASDNKKKLATVVEDNQKAPFSIATTPGCRGGRYFFPLIVPLYPWYVTYITEC